MTAVQAMTLSDDMLERFRTRAATYDQENRFFQEDFDDLRKAGYLLLPLPKELGGGGLSLAEMCRQQRRLAYYAPATALGINMHVYWVGVAADLWRQGDKSLEWILRETAAGEVFAAGHAESGNDIPVMLSTTKAERVEGGYRFTGHKHFGSLTPVWTRFGLHGMDTSDPAKPKIVHAFMTHDTKGYSIKQTWDVLGMRATRSDDTVLDNVFVPDRYIARVVDTAVESVKKKKSMAISRTMAYHPEVQHAVAKMMIELESIGPHLDSVAEDWSNGVNHGMLWPAKILAAKYHAVESAWGIVDQALDVAGGFGIFRAAGVERMFRDARLGRIHPGNSFFTHEIVGKTALGINPDEQPRWG
jgi:alkylation response protein AidB-like acyl-CoA dehydrogenase